MTATTTLDDFLSLGERWPRNAYVSEPGFERLYVRIGRRHLQGKMQVTLDIANILAENPGSGAFTRLVQRLNKEYPNVGLFVESVHNERFRDKLLSLGFRFVGPVPEQYDYFMPPPAEVYSPLNIARLTRQFIKRYSGRLELAIKYPQRTPVNVEETTQYLNIWHSIENKKFIWDDLSQEERREIDDARAEEETW